MRRTTFSNSVRLSLTLSFAILVAALFALSLDRVNAQPSRAAELEVTPMLAVFERETSVGVADTIERARLAEIDSAELAGLLTEYTGNLKDRVTDRSIEQDVRRRVQSVLDFHHQSDLPIIVIDDPEPSAEIRVRVCIAITTGLLDRLRSDDELRAVIAHELSHEYVIDASFVARRQRDFRTMRDLELACDGFAIYTLASLGHPTTALHDALSRIIDVQPHNTARAVGAVMNTSEPLATVNTDTHPSREARLLFTSRLAATWTVAR